MNQGPIMAVAAKTGKWRLEIVKRNDVRRFEVLLKRWIVERTLAWMSHYPDWPAISSAMSDRCRFHLSRYDPPHAAPFHSNPFSVLSNFPERLLEAR
jgi:hypothetical protein